MNNPTPEKSPVATLPRKTVTFLLLLALAGQLAWAVENQFFNTFLFNHISPNPQAVSLMVAITAVVSTVTAITMGTLSDRTRSKWGKRRPYIVFGFVFWGIMTAIYPVAAYFQSVALGVFMAILFDSLMSFFGATASDAALNAYVTDNTTMENRGRLIGSMQIMTWVSYLIVYGGAGFIIQAFGYFTFFYALGGLVTLLGVLVAPRLVDPPATEEPKGKYWAQIAETFSWKALTANRNLFLLLISLTLFMVAFNVFFPYLLIYMQHYLKLEYLKFIHRTGCNNSRWGYPFGLPDWSAGRPGWQATGCPGCGYLRMPGTGAFFVRKRTAIHYFEQCSLAGSIYLLGGSHANLDERPVPGR